MSAAPLVTLTDAAFGYGRRAVVAGVNCAVEAGRCLGIYGPNGVGKSTLLRGITGLLRPTAGTVTGAAAVHFGYLPQQRAAETHWPMTALDAACLATSARRRFGWVGSQRRSVRQRLEVLHLGHLARRPFFQLSGGQQQRVLLAGALAAEPQVLLLDEPMGGIDAHARDLLLQTLLHSKAQGLAIVLVSHDPADLLSLADQQMLLRPSEEAGEPATGQLCSAEEMIATLSRRRDLAAAASRPEVA